METGSRWLLEPGTSQIVWLGGVGVDFRIPGELTGGAVSVVEHPVLPGTLVPPHVHRAEDELSIVLEGHFGVRVGDEIFDAGPGSYIYKPRAVPHAFWNATTKAARLIELIWPAGFERFFVELAAAYEAGHGVPAPERIDELAARYDVDFLMEWAPELEARYGVSLIHKGGS